MRLLGRHKTLTPAAQFTYQKQVDSSMWKWLRIAINGGFDKYARDTRKAEGCGPANTAQWAQDPPFNAKPFFDKLRKTTGKLSQAQVDSVNAILRAGASWPIAWMAYGLATAWHESRFLPIMEKGGTAYLSKYDTGRLARILGNTPEADGDGILYAGRGFVQLTGRRNYGLAGAELGLDLLNHPDLALERETAAKILVWGMEGGKFTGKKLSDYLASRGEHKAYVRARRIINGTDRAELIANYAGAFEKALAAGEWT